MKYAEMAPALPNQLFWVPFITSILGCLLGLFVLVIVIFRLVMLIISNVPKPTSLDYIVVVAGIIIVGIKLTFGAIMALNSFNNTKGDATLLMAGSISVLCLNIVILALYVAAFIALGGQDPTGLTSSVLLLCIIIVGLELIMALVTVIFLCWVVPQPKPCMMMRPMPMYMPVFQTAP